MKLATLPTLVNPYWDELRDQVRHNDMDGAHIGGLGNYEPLHARHQLTSQYAWTITDPDTVAFVAEYAGTSVVDPLAGTGYWAYLLGQLGVDVVATDVAPPDQIDNHWHRAGITHVKVTGADAVASVREHGAGRTLLLSWPPYDAEIGHEVLAAFPGDRVIYVGEGEGGCCGDDYLFDAFAAKWVEVAEHRPVQFWGMHDYVTVYDRRVKAVPA